MTKKVIFFSSSGIPYFTGNGSLVLSYGIVTCLQTLGYEVIVVPVAIKKSGNAEYEKRKEFLESKGIRIKVFDSIKNPKQRSGYFDLLNKVVFASSKNTFYIDKKEKEDLLKYIVSENIDLLYAYGWDSLMLISNIPKIKKIVSVVDLLEFFYERRRAAISQMTWKSKYKNKFISLIDRKNITATYEGLSMVDYIVEHAYQHAQYLKGKKLNTPIMYLPHPLEEKQKTYLKSQDVSEDRITILILGSLKGVASQLGFEFFFNELLPALESKKDQITKPLKFRIVGHGSPKKNIVENASKNEHVELVGFVEKLEEEYSQADIMLVNVPVSHGFRTRIAEAFSYGLCVVAHAANAEGMPEIEDGYNAATSDKANELATKLIDLANTPSKRYEYGKNAIDTFNKRISQKAAIDKYKKILAELDLSSVDIE